MCGLLKSSEHYYFFFFFFLDDLEFVVDFLNVLPPTGVLASRVFLSPGHAKRLAKALMENVKKYEDKFDKIDEIKENEQKIGFM